MKTFEENWTAWLDGHLTGEELEEFESSLPDKVAAEVEKRDAQRLSAFLKEELGSVTMTNQEFFHHQLRGEVEKNAPETSGVTTRLAPEPRASWWSIPRMAWTGLASLAVFALCTFFVIRDDSVGGQSTYLTQIINARVDPDVSPDATISMFERKEDKVTVLWVDGLQSLPSEYAAR